MNPPKKGVVALIAVLVLLALAAFFILGRGEPETAQHHDSSPAALVEVILPDTLSVQAQAGQTAYETNCALCHGVDAAGQDSIAPPLVHVIYEPNHHGDQSFHRAVRFGVRAHHWRFGDMPAIEDVSESEVTDIIAYVRELQRANGIF